MAGVVQLVGVSAHRLKGHQFDSRSGHMLGCGLWPQVAARVGSNRSMFLSHIDVSLLSLSLPSSLSKINDHVFR